MSDLVRLVTFADQIVTPQNDALIYEAAVGDSGFFYGAEVTIKNTNTLHITAGFGIIAGREFVISEGDIPIVLPSTGTQLGRVYMHLDLSNASLPCDILYEVANVLTPVIQEDNVNIFNGVFEFNVATFTATTTQISDLVNVAPYLSGDGIIDMLNVAKVAVPASGWTQTTVDGQTMYTNTVAVTKIYDEHPDVFIAETNATLPSSAEQAAFGAVTAVIANVTDNNLVFYAASAPTDNFSVYARGVVA